MTEPNDLDMSSDRRTADLRAAAVALGLLACLLWSYWPTLADLNEFWSRNPDYSSGQLVPLVAACFLWRGRRRLQLGTAGPCWWGLGVILAAQALRFGGLYFFYSSAERFSLVLTVVGLVLLVGGWLTFSRAKWVLLFLFLMVPFPRRIHAMVALPLQDLSTRIAAFSLELSGYFVVREGNVLRINDDHLVAVTEACGGLRMLTAFLLVAAVLAFLTRAPKWHKLTLLASSVPVAVFTNAARLLITSMFIVHSGSPRLQQLFHDYAGLTMMPVAILILMAELRFLSLLSHPAPRFHPQAATCRLARLADEQ